MNTYELKVKGKFQTFRMEVMARELDLIVLALIERPTVKSVKVKRL